jgi:hypothetical protein
LATKRQSLSQAGRPEPGHTAVIGFSDGHRNELPWRGSSDIVRADSQVHGPTRVVDDSGGANTGQKDRHVAASGTKPANYAFTDFTVVSGYIDLFRLVAAGALFGVLRAVFRIG